MTDDLEELERKAKAATPGPWVVPENGGSAAVCQDDAGNTFIATAHWAQQDRQKANAAFIAAANPATVLALIAENRALKERADTAAHYAAQVVDLEARLARMREALEQEWVPDAGLSYARCEGCDSRIGRGEPHAPSCLLSTEGEQSEARPADEDGINLLLAQINDLLSVNGRLKAEVAFATDRAARMREALVEARSVISEGREEIVLSASRIKLGEDGEYRPVPGTLDEMTKPHVESLDAVLAKIDAALSTEGDAGGQEIEGRTEG